MKEKEGFVDYPEQQVILYVEKDDGEFGPMQTGSYLSANYMDDYMSKRRNLEIELRAHLAAARITPVKYYMTLGELSISELSARAGIRKSRVKKHLSPEHFGCITAEELRRYAVVFNIPPANLLQVILVSCDGIFEASLVLETGTGEISVHQTPTANPYIFLTKIEASKR